MATITAKDGPGVDIPDAWSKDMGGNGVHWLVTRDVRGAVTISHHEAGNIDLTSDKPFGDRRGLVEQLHSLIDEQDTRDGIIFASIGNTKRLNAPYSVSILRSVVEDEETSQQMKIYYANMLLALDDGITEVTATAMGVSPEVTRREDEIMATVRPNSSIVTNGKTVYWQRDPYMPSYDHGEPMYAYENAVYDKQYPKHPVARIRQLVGHVIVNN